jgi:predicted nuclease of predicted toxin-antitoxin system
MKFLADECCEAPLVQALRDEGHDVLYAQESLRAATDDQLLHLALAQNRILLTEDKDFGELVYRLHKPAYGIILLRFDETERLLKISRLHLLLAQAAERLPFSFVVLEAHKIRSRPLV